MTITIPAQHAAGLRELLALAERGREDYLYEIKFGDYTADEIKEAEARWALAEAAADALRPVLTPEGSDQ